MKYLSVMSTQGAGIDQVPIHPDYEEEVESFFRSDSPELYLPEKDFAYPAIFVRRSHIFACLFGETPLRFQENPLAQASEKTQATQAFGAVPPGFIPTSPPTD